MTKHVSGENGQLKKLHAVRLEWVKNNKGGLEPKEIPGSEFTMDVDLLLLAMGFVSPEKKGILDTLNLKLDPRGNVSVDENYISSLPGVFAAGDAKRGASLIVWAIAEGRKCAKGIDQFLMGETELS